MELLEVGIRVIIAVAAVIVVKAAALRWLIGTSGRPGGVRKGR